MNSLNLKLLPRILYPCLPFRCFSSSQYVLNPPKNQDYIYQEALTLLNQLSVEQKRAIFTELQVEEANLRKREAEG